MITLTKNKLRKVKLKLNRPLEDAYKGILDIYSSDARSSIQAGIVTPQAFIALTINAIWTEVTEKGWYHSV